MEKGWRVFFLSPLQWCYFVDTKTVQKSDIAEKWLSEVTSPASSPGTSTWRSLKMTVNTTWILIFNFYSENKLFLLQFLLNLFPICHNTFPSHHYFRFLIRFLRSLSSWFKSNHPLALPYPSLQLFYYSILDHQGESLFLQKWRLFVPCYAMLRISEF